MKLSEVVEKLSLTVITAGNSDSEVERGYTSDLLSDVMAHCKENSVLITIQSHKNSVAVASMVDMPAIFICNSRPVPDDMVNAAKSEDIGIYLTEMDQYTLSWKLNSILKN